MSKEHYITPDEFNKMVYDNKIMTFGYTIPKHFDQKYAENVINVLRTINAKDPGFKYSCECDTNSMRWLFGYTDKSVYIEAYNTANQMILKNRKSYGDDDEDVEGFNHGNYSPCSCPFNA